ncbi:MAG: hypothetical protein JSU96_03630 [Acidobacteriota bacterium]|nr:MAG: hypothetical protein JSU96_03630 [Acidobacteriota bacterium]
MSVLKRRRILVDRIIETLNQMPAEVRRVFILSHYREFAMSEIAAVLETTEKDAEALLRRGNSLIARNIKI